MRGKFWVSAVGVLVLGSPLFAQALPRVVNPSAVTNPDGVTNRVPVDPAVAADHAREVADMSKWIKLRAEYKKLETSNPAAAIAAYQAFLTSTTLHPTVAITAADVVARLDISGIKDTSKAEIIYQWTQTNYGTHRSMARTIPGRAEMLNAESKYQEAADLLKANWDAVLGIHNLLSDEYLANGLRAWDDAATHLKQRDQLIDPMTKAFSALPLILDDRDADSGWAYDTIIKVLLDAKRGKEALGWARMRFEECPYDTYHIAIASKQLTDTWKLADPDSKGWIDFAKAQADAKMVNPLLQIPLPALDAKLWQTAFDTMSPGTTNNHYVITLLIAKGYYGDAMKVAEAISDANPKGVLGVMEGCRVLKAAQLNLLGASQLITSLQGKGDDPLPAFYKDNAPGKIDLQ